MKLCVCSYLGHPTRACICAEPEIKRYRSLCPARSWIASTFHLTLTPVPMRLLGSDERGESSAALRQRVQVARELQRDRYGTHSLLSCNAQASGRSLLSQLDSEARQLLDSAAASLSLSARAYHRVIKVARTIADLAGQDRISAAHLGEALRYRPQVSLH